MKNSDQNWSRPQNGFDPIRFSVVADCNQNAYKSGAISFGEIGNEERHEMKSTKIIIIERLTKITRQWCVFEVKHINSNKLSNWMCSKVAIELLGFSSQVKVAHYWSKKKIILNFLYDCCLSHVDFWCYFF